MPNSKFPNTTTTFFDSRKCGVISVRGFMLEPDEDGFIEGPADMADEIEPHGFVPMERPAKPAKDEGKGKK